MKPDSELDLLLAGGGGLKLVGVIVRALGGLGVSVLMTRMTAATAFGQYF
jgi:hypothetical protein